jgi:CheY-like chemotaxis protein
MNQPQPTILLVEDSEDDVFIMKNAMKRAGFDYPLQVVTDGQMALDYLGGTGDFSDRARFPLPFIVFLDLKLPFVHGFEVLTWTRQQEALKSVAVIVLTGSDQERDQHRAYALGARSYLVKPPTAAGLVEIFASLKSLWLSKVETASLASVPPPETA